MCWLAVVLLLVYSSPGDCAIAGEGCAYSRQHRWQALGHVTYPAACLKAYSRHCVGQAGLAGYQEGSRRTVQCEEGHFVGMELWYDKQGKYKDNTIAGLRLLCSR
jgi:hypothetical protein